MHWLYRIIPRERPRWFDPRLLTWVLLGNEEDGLFGPPYDGRATFYPPTLWGAIRWAVRNPFHNLLFHVLAWPGGPFWKWGKVPGWNGYIGFRPPKGVFGIAIRKETTLGIIALLALLQFSPAFARDDGQWDTADTVVRDWYHNLMQPDQPAISCCGEADAYWSDTIAAEDGKAVAVITDARPDEPLRRRHIEPGTRIVVPGHKLKFDRGNPTGHGVIFIDRNGSVLCYVQASGV